MTRPKIALTWLSSCGGCEESVLDLGEELLELQRRMEIIFWPIALDHKLEAVARLDDRELLAALINGAIRTEEQRRLAVLFRKKSRFLIAHGSCAHTGGVVGLGNLYSNEALLRSVYLDSPIVENPRSVIPGIDPVSLPTELVLSPLCQSVAPLCRVVPVDFILPGCPPTPELVGQSLRMLLDGSLPPFGSTLADSRALCDTCPRRPTLAERIAVKRFKRLHEEEWDPETCFLTQHFLCLGPVTRGGCRARCIQGNMPCRGCFGAPDGVLDQGAKAAAFVASLMDAESSSEVAAVASTLPDLPGLFSRYGLAASVLRRREKGAA